MKKILLFSLLFLCFFGPARAQFPSALSNQIQEFLDSANSDNKYRGLSVGVYVPGLGHWSGSSGFSPLNTQTEPNQFFCMGSNTKTYMAALFLLLQERGDLDLDDSIGTWVSGKNNINGAITIRQCLNHRSGLRDYMEYPNINDSIFDNPSKIWSTDEMLSVVGTPHFLPNNSFRYSNTNYIVLGAILESKYQKPWSQVLQEVLLNPLGLSQTFYYFDFPDTLTISHPWTMNINGLNLVDLTETPYLDQLFSLASAAGGLFCTPADNINFWHKLSSGQILSAQSWQEMTTMRVIGGGFEYGLGIMRQTNDNGRLVFEHGGTFLGYIAENLYDVNSGICITSYTSQDSLSNAALNADILTPIQKLIMDSELVSRSAVSKISLSIFPNPSKASFEIQSLRPIQYQIFDSKGALIIEKTDAKIVDLGLFPCGIYVLTGMDDSGNYFSERLIKQ